MKTVVFKEERQARPEDEDSHDGVYGNWPGGIYGAEQMVQAALWEETSNEKVLRADKIFGKEK